MFNVIHFAIMHGDAHFFLGMRGLLTNEEISNCFGVHSPGWTLMVAGYTVPDFTQSVLAILVRNVVLTSSIKFGNISRTSEKEKKSLQTKLVS